MTAMSISYAVKSAASCWSAIGLARLVGFSMYSVGRRSSLRRWYDVAWTDVSGVVQQLEPRDDRSRVAVVRPHAHATSSALESDTVSDQLIVAQCYCWHTGGHVIVCRRDIPGVDVHSPSFEWRHGPWPPTVSVVVFHSSSPQLRVGGAVGDVCRLNGVDRLAWMIRSPWRPRSQQRTVQEFTKTPQRSNKYVIYLQDSNWTVGSRTT